MSFYLTLHVIDPSSSDRPLPIPEWIAKYIKNPSKCAQLNEKSFGETMSYYSLRTQFGNNTPLPKNLCGYTLRYALGSVQPEKNVLEIRKRMMDAYNLLSSNNDSLYIRLKGKPTSNLTIKLSPQSEADFCNSIDSPLKWCSK